MWKLTKWNQTNYIIFVSRKEVTKKVYDSIMNSIKLSSRINTVLMNSKNSKSSDRHRPLFNLNDKINNLKKSNKYIALSNLNIYYTWNNIKKSCENNRFKISAPTWNEDFELPDGSYSVSDIQEYFEHIL